MLVGPVEMVWPWARQGGGGGGQTHTNTHMAVNSLIGGQHGHTWIHTLSHTLTKAPRKLTELTLLSSD